MRIRKKDVTSFYLQCVAGNESQACIFCGEPIHHTSPIHHTFSREVADGTMYTLIGCR